jgi:protein-S-isoprenylcysteine O-methyltransferase Ste14
MERISMIAWVNFAILLLSTILFLFFYILSVSPAKREKTGETNAFRKCYHDRLIAGFLEFIITGNFILFHFFPIASPLPDQFPWSYWILLVIALLIGIPATLLMSLGIHDAGEETMRPKKEHHMYSGIYTRMRHPQAVGEVFLFPVIALLLNSPFLTIYSLIFFPIFMLMCYAEEQDLLLRYGDAYADYCKNTGTFWPKRIKSNAP